MGEFAEEAKTTGASLFDHAKGTAAAAIAAGSKAAEDIADEKLKDAESVSFIIVQQSKIYLYVFLN